MLEWGCVKFKPLTWIYGAVIEPEDKTRTIPDPVAYIVRKPDGSWLWQLLSTDALPIMGTEPSRDEAMIASVDAYKKRRDKGELDD